MALGHVFSGRVWGRDVASVISRGGHQFTWLVFEKSANHSKRAPDEMLHSSALRLLFSLRHGRPFTRSFNLGPPQLAVSQ